MIAGVDQKDCGKRYVCELMVAKDKLTVEETALLLTVQEAVDDGSAKALYKDAAYYGGFVKNMQSCAERFEKCKMKDTVRSFVQANKKYIKAETL